MEKEKNIKDFLNKWRTLLQNHSNLEPNDSNYEYIQYTNILNKNKNLKEQEENYTKLQKFDNSTNFYLQQKRDNYATVMTILFIIYYILFLFFSYIVWNLEWKRYTKFKVLFPLLILPYIIRILRFLTIYTSI